MTYTSPQAAMVIIGNEILSGRTEDKNLNFIAKRLANHGIKLQHVRVVPDIEAEIIHAVGELHPKYNYVFTTGGIGPTHDDITTQSIAKLFNMKVVRQPEAVEMLRVYYEKINEDLTEARLKMAEIPEGAELIINPVSGAPGFRVKNVYALAGVPRIMQATFEHIKLQEGKKIFSAEVSAFTAESKIAGKLSIIQNNYPTVEIGSYPTLKDDKSFVSIVLRSTDKESLDKALPEITRLLDETSSL